MALATYNQKRNFEKTPEPSGKKAKAVGFSYLVQKHEASHLHYDFRLEFQGVLKSWAVPKGPSLDPSAKRLAVEVEDHPVDYGDFEGTIPRGQYGGGTVMLWDKGSWEPDGDAERGLKAGKLEFTLYGQKLRGKWRLVRSSRSSSKPQWLLMKRNDDEARPGSDNKILEDAPLSIKSGRTMDEITSGKRGKPVKRIITARKPSQAKGARKTKSSGEKSPKIEPQIQGAIAKPLKGFLKPQLATLVDKAPTGDEWIHEIKFDGYRMQCQVQDGKVSIFSRNGNNWTSKLPELKAELQTLPVKSGVFDGELVSMRPDGTTDFQSLQNAFRDKQTGSLFIYFFDLLYLNGQLLLDCTLETRKSILENLLTEVGSKGIIQYSKHIVGQGQAYANKAQELGLEGVICKRLKSPYRGNRNGDWLKVKVVHKEEFVIGGFTGPEGSRVGLGAILVGYYDDENRFNYAGKVGTGFDEKTLKTLHAQLKKLEVATCPFDLKASSSKPSSKATWVKPVLIAQIRYGSLTRDKVLRHAVFEGLREDKSAKDVVLDKPQPVAKVGAKASSNVVQKKGKARSVKLITSASSKEEFEGVRLTSPDKVLYPGSGITKLDLASYYHDVSELILPHIKSRPIVLVRCPDGLGDSCFYQKHPGLGTPEVIRLMPIKEKSGTDKYAVIDDVEALTSLAQIGSLEIHSWGSTETNLDKPDRLIFDLDPDPGVEWKHVINGAKEIRSLLTQLSLESFVKTTGGKGLHVVVPIQRRNTWDEAKLFCRLVGQYVQTATPERYVLNMSKAARKGKIFFDYLRNDRGSTSIAPYSPRAREGAPISTPLAWDELTARIRSDKFNLKNIRSRMSTFKTDPWEGIFTIRQSIGTALKVLEDVFSK